MPVKILDNITVIECATFVTGPYATALLADLGARVIKIESAPDGDPYRYFAPDPAFSFNFAHLNRNKESLVLDLKAPAGKAICLELLENADVFVENFRPGTADRLGIGYETVQALNAKISLLFDLGVRPERTLCREAGLRYFGPGDERFVEPAQRSQRSQGHGHGGVGLRHRTFRRLRYSRARCLARNKFRRRLPRRNFAVASDVVVHRRDRCRLSCAPAMCPTAWRG